MKRDKWLKVKVSKEELEKLKKYAHREGWTMSQAVREFIKKLKN